MYVYHIITLQVLDFSLRLLGLSSISVLRPSTHVEQGWSSRKNCWGYFHIHSYCWYKKSCTSWYGKYHIIYRVSCVLGGAGFLPSIVSCQVQTQFFFGMVFKYRVSDLRNFVSLLDWESRHTDKILWKRLDTWPRSARHHLWTRCHGTYWHGASSTAESLCLPSIKKSTLSWNISLLSHITPRGRCSLHLNWDVFKVGLRMSLPFK